MKEKKTNDSQKPSAKKVQKTQSDPYTAELHQIMSKSEISASDVARMQYLIEDKKAKLNSIGYDGKTLLEKAVYHNSPELFQFLHAHGANVNQRNGKLETPLHTAARLKNASMREEILRANPDINAQDAAGKTPLLIAVQENDLSGVSSFLAHKADPNIAAKGGEVPMTEVKDAQIGQELLQNGARVNVATKDGKDPLTNAENLQDEKLIAEVLDATLKEEKHASDQNADISHKEETQKKESEKASQANGPVDNKYKQVNSEQQATDENSANPEQQATDENTKNQSQNSKTEDQNKKEDPKVPRLTPNNRLSQVLMNAAQHSAEKAPNTEEKKKQAQNAVEAYKKKVLEERAANPAA